MKATKAMKSMKAIKDTTGVAQIFLIFRKLDGARSVVVLGPCGVFLIVPYF